jgi:hypothetical protein
MPVSSSEWNSTNGFRTARMQCSVRNRVIFRFDTQQKRTDGPKGLF